MIEMIGRRFWSNKMSSLGRPSFQKWLFIDTIYCSDKKFEIYFHFFTFKIDLSGQKSSRLENKVTVFVFLSVFLDFLCLCDNYYWPDTCSQSQNVFFVNLIFSELSDSQTFCPQPLFWELPFFGVTQISDRVTQFGIVKLKS